MFAACWLTVHLLVVIDSVGMFLGHGVVGVLGYGRGTGGVRARAWFLVDICRVCHLFMWRLCLRVSMHMPLRVWTSCRDLFMGASQL